MNETGTSTNDTDVNNCAEPPWKKEIQERLRFAARTYCGRRSLTRDSSGRRDVNVKLTVDFPTPGPGPEQLSSGVPPLSTTVSRQSVSDIQSNCPPPSVKFDSSADFNRECLPENNMRLFDVDLSSDFIINSYKYESKSDTSTKCIIVNDKSMKKHHTFKTMDRHKELRIVNGNGNKRSEKEDEYQSDSSEELQYGPGIVNKLKTKYLSLTLRESQKRGVRPSLNNLRRATSLENILDEETKVIQPKTQTYYKKSSPVHSASSKNSIVSQYCARYMSINKGVESMKRAQSMDTLFRHESPKNVSPCVMSKSLTVDSRLTNGNDVVIIDNVALKEETLKAPAAKCEVAKELPPPDVVKQTMKIFENSTPCKGPDVSAVTKVKCVKTLIKPNPSDKKKAVKPMVMPKPVLTDFKRNGNSKLLNVKKDKIFCSNLDNPSSTEYSYLLVNPPPLSPIKPQQVKYISKKALDNIGKEGSSIKFTFEDNSVIGDSKTYLPKTKVNQVQPTLNQATNTALIAQTSIGNSLPSSSPDRIAIQMKGPEITITPTKQVAVIRPVVNKVINSSPPIVPTPALTNVEIEKNLINNVKSVESVNPLKENNNSSSACRGVDDTDNDSKCDGEISSNEDKVSLWDAKSWQSRNTVVFNFKNRKDIPDYIENDGLVVTPKKDKKLNGEGGFESEEDCGDAASPRAVDIVGGNIIINGKSNLRKQPKMQKLRIQFNDSATTLFEYPREDVPCAEDHSNAQPPAANVSSSTSSAATPLVHPSGGGATISTYTPSKTVDKFELGVTRVALSASTSPTQNISSSQDVPDSEESQSTPSPWSSHETTSDILF